MARKSLRKYESWLPFDSRLLPHIISFGHVKGIARVFLQIEIVLSVLVVVGVFAIVVIKVFILKQ